jgi:hypothetical protein
MLHSNILTGHSIAKTLKTPLKTLLKVFLKVFFSVLETECPLRMVL